MCLYDDVSNGKGVFAQLDASFTVNGQERYVGSPKYTASSGRWVASENRFINCVEVAFDPPAAGATLNFVNMNMGNHWLPTGGTSETYAQSSTDKIPNPRTTTWQPMIPVWEAAQLRARSAGACNAVPSAARCGTVIATIPKNAQVKVICQQWSAEINGPPKNPYWVEVEYNGQRGILSSYPMDYKDNYIDGLASCL
jgi:hypothetical protein